MGSEPTLDPDLEQVLEDIAADPRAKLFVTDPRKLLTGLRDESVETPASRTGLRPAERHLLEVYRHELAFLLRDVYRVELARRDSTSVQLAPVSESDLRSQIGALLRSKNTPSKQERFLKKFSDKAPVDAMQILAAALALEAAPSAQVCLANEYLALESYQTAKRAYEHILRSPQTSLILYCSWEGLACMHEGVGDERQSIRDYKKAREHAFLLSASDALASTTNLLRLSIIHNNRQQASTLVRWVDANFSLESPTLKENIRAIRAQQHKSSPNQELIDALIDSSGPSGQEVIHAFVG